MKDSEKEIIQQIRKGKRATISSIARTLKAPISTISDRIRKIEEKYVIKRSSILDFEKVGYYANSLLLVKIKPVNKINFIEFLKNDGNVNSVFITNSHCDLVVETVFENQYKAKEWMTNASMMFDAEISSIPILKTEEKEKFIP